MSSALIQLLSTAAFSGLPQNETYSLSSQPGLYTRCALQIHGKGMQIHGEEIIPLSELFRFPFTSQDHSLQDSSKYPIFLVYED